MHVSYQFQPYYTYIILGVHAIPTACTSVLWASLGDFDLLY